MKIVIDLTSLYDNFSGLERYALNISINLIKNDIENEYILVFKNEIFKDFINLIDNNRIKYVVVNGKNKLFFNQIKLPLGLFKIKADKYLFLAFPSPIIFRRKGIVNAIHDLTAFLFPETMKKESMLYFKYSIINAMKISETIITVSNSSKKDILKKFKPKNIVVINNGISDVFQKFVFNNELNGNIKRKYCLDGEYILCLGTLEPRKNLKLLLKAYSELKRENLINEKLVIVGRNGWKFENIWNELDILDIKDNIIFTGFVEDEYLPYIYSNSKIFVFPSIYEGFGIPVIEAGMMESIVISSDIDVLKEILGNDCIYFKSNNKESLKATILEVIGYSEEKKEYIRERLKEKSEKYSWEAESLKLLNLINKL
ncbi:glycosyltransferase family 1 protein [Clostridium tertium]|uniref:glycosyltransferase family 4 protein n=1 Tax=Clostridium tertium TaxID=1559 RepID=UPI00232DC854|nr:glycosyltransferase family 1 protein [Clostridium tertium]MDB1921702.1 glycosyltransferase family 1 protein [Clostridium tertium]MDB1924905.1 glycosyltransferase family 1 protein [Clostridium tertium]MDB1929544.1 glycosyltransferase family 1 protein [Clostridium tertium]